jgi:transcriptional regulator with XRE-family HTH domain
MTGCPATRHDTRVAYLEGCACPGAASAHYRYEKRLRAEHAAGVYRCVPVIGTRRRLQALCAIGYSQPELARLLGVTQQRVWQYLAGPRPTVRRTSAAKVAALYDRLADTPSANPRARCSINAAERNGWLPPLWWDDDTIDDADWQPPTAERTRPSRDELDEVKVDRACAGLPVHDLTRAERLEAVRRMRALTLSTRDIAARLRVDDRQVHRDLTDLALTDPTAGAA